VGSSAFLILGELTKICVLLPSSLVTLILLKSSVQKAPSECLMKLFFGFLRFSSIIHEVRLMGSSE